MDDIRLVQSRRGLRQALDELSEQDRKIAAESVALRADQGYVENSVGLGNLGTTFTDWRVFSIHDSYTIWGITAPTPWAHQDRDAVLGRNLNNHLSLAYTNKGAAKILVPGAFDAVLMASGTALPPGQPVVDNTVEAATDLGTPFDMFRETIIQDVNSGSLHLGMIGSILKPFQEIAVSVQSPGANYTLFAEYYDGTKWTSGSPPVLELDRTQGFTRKGSIELNIPNDWALVTVEGDEGTWVRLRTSTISSRVASLYSIRPASGVTDLLTRAPDQVRNRQMAWTSFEGKIYLTVPNAGPPSLEGSNYIQSGSSDALRRTYFSGFNRHEYVKQSRISFTLSDQGNIPVFSSGTQDFYDFFNNDAESNPLLAGTASVFFLTEVGDIWMRLGVRSGESYQYIDLISEETP